MTRYMVNKAMWEVDLTDGNLEAFKADPSGFLDEWEAAALEPVPPCPRGGALTEEERGALLALDFGALYAMGCNPYILWQFARSVSVPDRSTGPDLMESFRKTVEPYGYPDFAT